MNECNIWQNMSEVTVNGESQFGEVKENRCESRSRRRQAVHKKRGRG